MAASVGAFLLGAGTPGKKECVGNGCTWKRGKCVSCRELSKKKCAKKGCVWDTKGKVCESDTV